MVIAAGTRWPVWCNVARRFTQAPESTRRSVAGRNLMTAAQIFVEPDAMLEADLDAQSPAADLVRVYLNGIGRTALLSAQQEVELAKRIEAGVFARHTLDAATRLSPSR